MTSYFVQTNPMLFNIALLLARIAIGLCFVVHGLGKLGLVGSGNMQGFVGWLKGMGLPYAEVQARLAMLSELMGGLMIAVGFFTRFGLLACFFTMVIAAGLGHPGGGYLTTNNPPGNEYPLNLAVICAVLFLLGPGGYSCDALLFSL